MRQAFLDGEDIHRVTASQVFDVPFDQVTSLQRSRAKAVNFGIIYGISEFGLAKNIGVDVKTAREYISTYFKSHLLKHMYGIISIVLPILILSILVQAKE